MKKQIISDLLNRFGQRAALVVMGLLLSLHLAAQKRYAAVYAVGFYNVENLFDTEDDPDNTGDDEFLPNGPYRWTTAKYNQKLHNIAHVIGKLAREKCPVGPAFVGLAELENRHVVEDLINTEPIKSMSMQIIHYESPDHRGIDVGFIYNPRLFTVVSSHAHPTIIPDRPDYKTRDILEVNGIMAGERLTIFVNHWPSKYGGAASSPLRENSGRLVRHLADSVRQADPERKIIIMGDLNDNPDDKSCAVALGAAPTIKATPKNGYFNATWPLFAKGIGTLCYQNVWGLYDQQIISDNFLSKDFSTLTYWKTEVFNPDFITTPTGKYKGYPLRSFDGKRWQNGYADHFPTITYYIKNIDTVPKSVSTK